MLEGSCACGRVLFIQHDGSPGDNFAPSTPGWSLLKSIQRSPSDAVLRKSLNDAFHGTSLQADLEQLEVGRLLVTGWATDLCVDATVRSAAALGFQVVVVADAHTVSDRPHLEARQVIEHHHWVWRNLIAKHQVALSDEVEL